MNLISNIAGLLFIAISTPIVGTVFSFAFQSELPETMCDASLNGFAIYAVVAVLYFVFKKVES